MALAEIRMYQGDRTRRAGPARGGRTMARSQCCAPGSWESGCATSMRASRWPARATPAIRSSRRRWGHARRLDARTNGWARWAADLTRALVAHRRGQESAPLFEDAEAGALAADMRGVAARDPAPARAGRRGPGDGFRRRGHPALPRVRAPDRYAAMIAPLSTAGLISSGRASPAGPFLAEENDMLKTKVAALLGRMLFAALFVSAAPAHFSQEMIAMATQQASRSRRSWSRSPACSPWPAA
jgi:hypothetical protein